LRYTTEVDLSDTRNAVKPLADALFSANRVDPSILDDALQAWSTLRFENQMAVAEAVLTAERRQRGGRAEELLRREDTPPQIRAFLLRGLRVEQ
jgi:hypothetical protein